MSEHFRSFKIRRIGEHATRPIARFPGCLTSLLLLAWNGHAASSRLVMQPGKRTLTRVQLRNLGSMLSSKSLLIVLAILAAGPARAGLFDDEEARRRLLAIESEMRQKNTAAEERIVKLEASVKNQGLLDLVNQIEELKGEQARLRGQIEVVSNQIATVDKKQRDFYLDIDSRLQRLEQPANAAKPRADAVVPVPVPAQPVDPKLAAKQDASEKKAYENAYSFFQKKDYTKAITAFEAFGNDYPTSQLLPGAHYWIGLSHFNMRDLNRSLAIQQNLLRQFPESSKAPDAMLAIAAIESEQGDSAGSRNVLEDIIARYPNSDAAGKARLRLANKTSSR
ncbi:MAG: tol-pal system protein YbgF [Pseudomonadota bacterium]